MNDYNIQEAIKLYKNGMSLTQISKQIGIDRRRLSRDFKKNGIVIVQNGQKYNYNQNIFEQIDTEEKAYWLGFLYADGYINDRSIELTLQENDYDHLVKFREFIGDESIQITYRESTNSYRIYIGCKKIAQDLIKLGCVQAKSYILKFPTLEQVPEYLVHHFMRGYFDGDGSIGNYKPPKNNRGTKKQLHFSVVGTPEFLNEYEKYILQDLKRNNPNKRQRRFDWSDRTECISYAGNIQVPKILQFLYNNATIYLQRKYNLFNMILPSQDETDEKS